MKDIFYLRFILLGFNVIINIIILFFETEIIKSFFQSVNIRSCQNIALFYYDIIIDLIS